MLRKSYRNVRNSSRTKKLGQIRVNRGFSGIREAPNAPDLGKSDNDFLVFGHDLTSVFVISRQS